MRIKNVGKCLIIFNGGSFRCSIIVGYYLHGVTVIGWGLALARVGHAGLWRGTGGGGE